MRQAYEGPAADKPAGALAGAGPVTGDPTPVIDPAEGIFQLDVTVNDQEGKPVSGLGLKDFTLLDNGQPAKIRSFHASGGTPATPDTPVELILLIDRLNLTSQQVPQAEREVEKFLRQNGGRLAQPTSIYVLSNNGLSSTSQRSTNGNALAEEIAHPGKLPLLWRDYEDWVLRSLRNSDDRGTFFLSELSRKALFSIAVERRQKPGRKLLVWVGFGWPSKHGGGDGWTKDAFDWVVESSTRLREARIALYSVTAWLSPDRSFHYQDFLKGVKSAKEMNNGEMALEVLATQSGGRVADQTDDIAGTLNRYLEDAGSFYTLSFDPTQTDRADEYHDLQVQVDKTDLIARSRTGYYDQPVYYDRPNPARKLVSVAQLEELLGRSHGDSDEAKSLQMSGLELTERMSSARLSCWKGGMPGQKSWAALVGLADASAFLDPPADEVPKLAPLDLAARRQMLSKTIDYLKEAIPRLPNFFATRTTIRYEQPQPKEEQTWKTAEGDRTLHKASSSTESVLYRDGDEVVQGKKPKNEMVRLTTKGTFGPILSTVFLDAAHGSMNWIGWEKGDGGVRAVFRYTVPKGESHYNVSHCCLSGSDGTGELRVRTGYHGKIAIDPVSGAILRITVEADLLPKLPPRLALIRSDILVEYGPVEIGDSTYICPVRSVTISRGRTTRLVNESRIGFETYGPFETVMGDVTFAGYHKFGSESLLVADIAPSAKDSTSSDNADPVRAPADEPSTSK